MSKQTKARLLVTAQFALLTLIFLAALSGKNKRPHDYLVFEIVTTVIGLLVLVLAWSALRPSLQISPIPKEGAVFISLGIYRYIRHPMYLGVILVGLGFAGYANSTFGWFSELLLVIVLYVKATFEDGLLRESYPEALDYQRQTSKVLPCIGRSCSK